MTLEQLRMLTKIAEEGSVFAAAEALHKTQPTVSVSMKKLETELGLQLLARDQRRATLTDEGQVLYDRAKAVLRQVDIFEGTAKHLAAGNEASLHIAIEVSCPMPLMLQIMDICNEQFPETQFSFSMEIIMGALEQLTLDEAELAITPFGDINSSFESFTLAYSEMVRVAAPNFPLCRAQDIVQAEQLKEHVQVIVKDSSRNPSPRTFDVLEGGRHWYVNDYDTKKKLLLAGMGWGMLHRHHIESELRNGSLLPLEIANQPLNRKLDIAVVRKNNKIHGPVATALWSKVQQITWKES